MIKTKKHYLVYQITNLINEKIYIGRHATVNLEDGYMGSGTLIIEAIQNYGIENFRKEILFDFDNPKEMIEKECEILTQDFVDRESNYNISVGGAGGNGMLGKTHNAETREVLRNHYKNTVMVSAGDGKYFRVYKDDPRYLNGELKINTYGTVCVKDLDGKKFRVSVDDPRRLTGELVGAYAGNKRPDETVEKHIQFMLEYWKTHTHTENGLQNMRDANIGKLNVIDKDGNEFRVDTQDPRLKTGELVFARKGYIWIHNDNLEKSRFLSPKKVEGYLSNGEGWERGLKYYNSIKRIFINNPETKENKKIDPSEIDSYLSSGWERGRIVGKDIGNIISASRKKNPGKWMHNPKTLESRIIHLNEISEFKKSGWIVGRGKLKKYNI